MKVRFQTSIPGFIEGRVIEVDHISPDLQRFLNNGVVTLVAEDGPETAVADAPVERASLAPARRRRGAATACLPTDQ